MFLAGGPFYRCGEPIIAKAGVGAADCRVRAWVRRLGLQGRNLIRGVRVASPCGDEKKL